MGVSVRIDLHRANIREVLSGELGPVVRAAHRYGRAVSNSAKRKAPVDKGAGRASIDYLVIVAAGTRVTFRVGTDIEYMLYQHEGTGIYGPRGRPIRPVTRQFLRFPVKGVFGPVMGTPKGRAGKRKGRGNIVFARQVRGVPPSPFLVDALKEEIPWPVIVH